MGPTRYSAQKLTEKTETRYQRENYLRRTSSLFRALNTFPVRVELGAELDSAKPMLGSHTYCFKILFMTITSAKKLILLKRAIKCRLDLCKVTWTCQKIYKYVQNKSQVYF